MQILDEDMQMVRDFLATAQAPEFVKGHFENLIEQHAKEAARVEDLEEELKSLRGASVERDELQEQVDELEAELERRDDRAFGALETVKYWLHDVLVMGGPMRKRPRDILRIVEEAL